MRTQEEINQMVIKLRAERETLPLLNIFGYNNLAKIDAQIDVLEGRAMPDDYDDYDEDDESMNVWTAADDADRWKDGEDLELVGE